LERGRFLDGQGPGGGGEGCVLPSGAQLSAVRLAGDVNAQVDSASLERQVQYDRDDRVAQAARHVLNSHATPPSTTNVTASPIVLSHFQQQQRVDPFHQRQCIDPASCQQRVAPLYPQASHRASGVVWK
jgi:hypothetical protein